MVTTLHLPEPDGNGTDYGIVALDTANGKHAWTTGAAVSTHDLEIPQAIAASPTGSEIVVTGTSGGSHSAALHAGQGHNAHQFTVAYSPADGALFWSTRVRLGELNGTPAGPLPLPATKASTPPLHCIAISTPKRINDSAVIAYRPRG